MDFLTLLISGFSGDFDIFWYLYFQGILPFFVTFYIFIFGGLYYFMDFLIFLLLCYFYYSYSIIVYDL